MNKTILIQGHDIDLSVFDGVDEIAIDTEAMGLELHRDRMCMVQIGLEDGTCYLLQMPQNPKEMTKTRYPNLCSVLRNPKIRKIFHYGRFDIAILYKSFGVLCQNVVCTKIASKLVRTYSNKHGLKTLCKELINRDLSKEQQSSDWGSQDITESQKHYAAADVLYLHQIFSVLNDRMIRENVHDLADKIFKFLPTVAQMDVLQRPIDQVFGWE